MFVTMVIAALAIDALFSAADLIPTGPRPSRDDIFGSVEADYKLALNLIGLAVFAVLIWMTIGGGATDPACGMRVDRRKAIRREFGGETFYFCSEHCLHAYELERSARAPRLDQEESVTT
jgi:YHS domain-containing protein